MRVNSLEAAILMPWQNATLKRPLHNRGQNFSQIGGGGNDDDDDDDDDHEDYDAFVFQNAE
jgi:hypothetical protein